MVLRTPRLVLTPVQDGDVPQLHRHWNDADVGHHLWDGVPVPESTVREVVGASLRNFREAGYGIWALRRTPTGPVIGTCGLREWDGQVELLFSLDPAHRGQGLVTEAARAVLGRATVVGGIVAFTDKGNLASQRVLARLGMTPCDFAAPWVRWRLGKTG